MTCVNGHTSRVYIHFFGVYKDGVDPIEAGAHPVIRPEVCPECGADWRVPDKGRLRKP